MLWCSFIRLHDWIHQLRRIERLVHSKHRWAGTRRGTAWDALCGTPAGIDTPPHGPQQLGAWSIEAPTIPVGVRSWWNHSPVFDLLIFSFHDQPHSHITYNPHRSNWIQNNRENRHTHIACLERLWTTFRLSILLFIQPSQSSHLQFWLDCIVPSSIHWEAFQGHFSRSLPSYGELDAISVVIGTRISWISIRNMAQSLESRPTRSVSST